MTKKDKNKTTYVKNCKVCSRKFFPKTATKQCCSTKCDRINSLSEIAFEYYFIFAKKSIDAHNKYKIAEKEMEHV